MLGSSAGTAAPAAFRSSALTASGGSVSWWASASSAQFGLSDQQGTLASGQTGTLTVTVSRSGGAAGSAVLAIGADASSDTVSVPVSWAASG